MYEDFAAFFCRVAIALVFCVSSLGKLRDMANFQRTIVSFQLIPPFFANSLSWMLVLGEITVIVMMVWGQAGLFLGFGLALVLLSIFLFALSVVVIRKQKVTCNCFGKATHHVSVYDLVRNSLLITCALAGLLLADNTTMELSLTSMLLLGAMATLFVIVTTSLRDILITLIRPLPTLIEKEGAH